MAVGVVSWFGSYMGFGLWAKCVMSAVCLCDSQEEFRLHFKNISKIMDCVGCSKCRLWGKLQVRLRPLCPFTRPSALFTRCLHVAIQN